MHLTQHEKLHLLIYCYTIISTLIGMCWSSISLSPPVTDVVRYVNESYIVTCMDEQKRPVKWSRLKGTKPISDKGHPHLMRLNMGTALVFEQISADDRGQYQCKTGEDSITFKMIVISPITFMDTPSVQTAQEHHATTIKCDVRGDPKPKILWKFDGRDITPPKYKIVPGGLEIKNVSLEDKGTYTCRAYQVSQVTSMFEEKGIRLNVQHKPMSPKVPLYPRQNEAWGYLGGEVNLTCEAVAEPAANFTWFRQHKKTVPGRFIHRPHISTLQIYIQNDSIFGGYMCKATNKLGSLSQIITLYRGEKPPQPERVRMRGATSDTLSVEVVTADLNHTRLEPKMLPFELRAQYRAKGENVKWHEAATTDFKIISDDDRITLSGLNHNTEYEIRVATRNLAGLSDYTSPVIGRTLGLQADSVTAGVLLVGPTLSLAVSLLGVIIIT